MITIQQNIFDPPSASEVAQHLLGLVESLE